MGFFSEEKFFTILAICKNSSRESPSELALIADTLLQPVHMISSLLVMAMLRYMHI